MRHLEKKNGKMQSYSKPLSLNGALLCPLLLRTVCTTYVWGYTEILARPVHESVFLSIELIFDIFVEVAQLYLGKHSTKSVRNRSC